MFWLWDKYFMNMVWITVEITRNKSYWGCKVIRFLQIRFMSDRQIGVVLQRHGPSKSLIITWPGYISYKYQSRFSILIILLMLTITHPGLIADLHFLYCDAYQDGSHNFIMNDGLCTHVYTNIWHFYSLWHWIETHDANKSNHTSPETTNYTRFMGHIIKCSV